MTGTVDQWRSLCLVDAELLIHAAAAAAATAH